MSERGHISIHTENILPIIKKWLYAEKDIYLRELVANASDALTKMQKISLTDDVKNVPEPKITIALDKTAGTLTISDSGLGMTEDEVKKYINQIAFSGVTEFVKKYEGKDEQSQIIGHFGLGFYSAFMVSSKVEIQTLSYQPGSQAVHWACSGDTEFTLDKGTRTEIGTTIVLHIAQDSQEMLDSFKIEEILNHYCAFIRYPIELDGKQINETTPLWTKNASALTDEDYKEFYLKVFPMAPEPLFWIHLNLDYPVNLRGILYFPKFSHEFEATEGQVKLFCNQVFVADNCKEIIPEYLTVLKGVLDIPDLPLNVSRSYLQSDPQVKKITEHIVKKVADKFAGMAKTERENFEKFWKDVHPFVKYCMMRDQKFCERMQEHLIFESTSDKITTLDEYLERVGEKTEKKVIYVTDKIAQANLIRMFKDQELEAIIADTNIDKHFIPFLEMQSKKKYEFMRIDSDVSKFLVDESADSKIVDPKDSKTLAQKIEDLFNSHLKIDHLKFKISSLKSDRVPAMLLQDESDRRMSEMSKFMPFGDMSAFRKPEKTLMINSNSPLVKQLAKLAELPGRDADVKILAEQIYDLAYLQHGQFSADGMQAFIERSVAIMNRIQ
jgi:molecular chaperone HtpG